MRTLSVEEVAEEARFISDSEKWPNWPILPVKHINRGEPGHPSNEEVGVLVDTWGGETPKPVVHLVNLFDLTHETLAAAESIEFDSIEAMVQAGWIGD